MLNRKKKYCNNLEDLSEIKIEVFHNKKIATQEN